MIEVLKQKENDCCICAYAMSEKISWKIAKRRLRKHIVSKKNLGVSSNSVRDKGLSGYTIKKDGSFATLHEAFNFKSGIVFLSWGDGSGHAVFWDGFKFIDHKKRGRFNMQRDLSRLNKGESVNLVLVKDKCSFVNVLFSKTHSFLFKLLSK